MSATARDLLAALDAAMQRVATVARRQGATQEQADAIAERALRRHLAEVEALSLL